MNARQFEERMRDYLGIEPSKHVVVQPTKATYELVWMLHDQGMSNSEIAKGMNMGLRTVTKTLNGVRP